MSSALTLTFKDLLDIKNITDTDGTSVCAGDSVDANTGVPLGSLTLVHATDALKSLLGLKLVLVSGGGVNVGHVATGAAASEVVGQAVDVDQTPLVFLKGFGHARDDNVGTEVQYTDRVLQVGVDILD